MAYDWAKRAAFRQRVYDRQNNEAVRLINKAYDRVTEQLTHDIDSIITTYATKTQMTPFEAMEYLRSPSTAAQYASQLSQNATKLTSRSEWIRIHTLNRTDAYTGRLSRIEDIQYSAYVGLSQAADIQLKEMDRLFPKQMNSAYSMSMYDVQRAAGYGFTSAGVPDKAIRKVMTSNWAGENYSEAVWKNRDVMADSLNSAMLEQVTIGKLSSSTIKDMHGYVDFTAWKKQLSSVFGSELQFAKYAANRLIRTESAYVTNQANALVYEEVGIEQYEFIATLDRRTSEVCGEHDGLIDPGTGNPYDLAKMEVGVNYPPLHPHCRSSTGAVIDTADRSRMQRRARKADGKTELIPADMNYKEWQKWQNDGCPDIKRWRESKAPKAQPFDFESVKPIQKDVIFSNGTNTEDIAYSRKADVYESPSGVSVRIPTDVSADGQHITPQQVARVVDTLPDALKKQIKIVELVDYENPRDAHWRKKYKNFGNSFAVGGNGKITFFKNGGVIKLGGAYSDKKVYETLAHEAGHCLDGSLVTKDGLRFSETLEWKKAMLEDEKLSGYKSVSDYGENSSREDFAESIMGYLVYPDTFPGNYPNRYKLVQKLLFGK